MARQTMVQLTDDLVRLLDAEAVRRGVSRSALIREAIWAHLAESVEAAIAEAIADGYRKVPPGTPDAWGDLDLVGERASGELLERLDEEEQRRGGRSW
jgi:predicted transcriptional regulator